METETLPNPVIKAEPIDERESLIAAAHEADSTDMVEESSPTPSESSSEVPAEVKPSGEPDNSESGPERARDAQGRFIKTEAEIASDKVAADKAVAEAQTESQYEKAKKEQQRQRGLLEGFQQEKENFRAEAAALRNEIAQERERLKQQASTPRQQFSSQELVKAVDDFSAQARQAVKMGDPDEADRFMALAEQARKAAGEAYTIEQQEAQKTGTTQFQTSWRQNMTAIVEKDPELQKPDTALSKEVQALLRNEDERLRAPNGMSIFEALPNGFALAAELAKLRLEAGSASELRKTVQQQSAEIDRLNGVTGLTKGGVTRPPEKRSFDSLSTEDQREYLKLAAEEADS